MKLALFRADGSNRLGLGHIMRCLALAQGLEETGVRPVFVIRDYEPKITELIQQYGYDVETIAQDSSFPEDAFLTLEFASRYAVRLILTDLSNAHALANLDEYGRFLETLNATGKFLITIDGLGEDGISTKMPFPCDIVIIPYYGAENRNYKFYSSTKSLLGPAYFIFRKEFIEAAKATRVIKKDVQNILVTIGGSDPLNLTTKVARGLNRLSATSLNLRIVVGPGFMPSVRQELEGILQDFKGNYALITGGNNLSELMLWSDLAITGGGLTKYETAVSGTPSIVISQDEHQLEPTKEFQRCGTILHLGLGSKVDEVDIAKAVEKLLEDDALRAEMTKRGRNMVDGRGVERIITEIPRNVLS